MRFRFLSAVMLAASIVCCSVPAVAGTSSSPPLCAPGDPVVWVNSKSHVYHLQGSQYYGKTKSGGYECKSGADKDGNRQAQTGGKSPASGTAGSRAAGSAASGAAGSGAATPVASRKPGFFHFGSSATPAPRTTAGAMGAPAASAAPAVAPSSGTSKRSRHRRGSSLASPAPGATAGSYGSTTPAPASTKKPRHHRRSKATPAPSAT